MNDVCPPWEPIPWDAGEAEAGVQEKGFFVRRDWQIAWRRVPCTDWPLDGVFGHNRDWFSEHEIAFVATVNDEELVLIERDWSGWPDPPLYGLASRPEGNADVRWAMWGSFDDLPATWSLPENQNA